MPFRLAGPDLEFHSFFATHRQYPPTDRSPLHITSTPDSATRLQVHPAVPQERALSPSHVWQTPGEPPWCEIFREGASYRMRFPGFADFLVHRDGGIECYPVPEIDEPTLQHLYLNQVVPAALSLQHRPVFHASCMAIDGTAAAFLGVSGRGKSTLATHLGLSGATLLTDDGLELRWSDGGYLALPSHPAVRLWDDSRDALLPNDVATAPAVSYTPKGRFLSEGLIPFAAEPAPLRRAYFLGEGRAEKVTITPLRPQAAHMAWVEHSFMLDAQDKARMASHFEQVRRLVALDVTYELDYPRRYDVLPSVLEALRNHLLQDRPTS